MGFIYWSINVARHIKKIISLSDFQVFQQIRSTVELDREVIRTNVLTQFHIDCTKHVTSRVVLGFYYSHIGKNFHEDWTRNLVSTGKCERRIADIARRTTN
ncbi:hypothetical protein DPMN_072553 [Dreissena polymorpha]|uniref:Uncharacterized protein n=1 Tax=Dreissena polymorpha TaxID=45954 RepID=A0A9D3Z8V7_DREPO|nr:hypothetical protein DPMN_072553 [Dreissena polymorpha]